jgi:two-component system CheB/CheR fusion protein
MFETESVEVDVSTSSAMFVVGIGASAGGLTACRSMLRNIVSRDACFVLCQHLSPNHESKLTEILSKDTFLKVRQLANGDKLKSGYLFIAPPNADVEIIDGHFSLTSPQQGPYPKPNINKFFASLSEYSGSRSIAVVLSGTGSDGASGISMIRGRGGIVLAEDPNIADYDGMPNASIATHMVDIVGGPELLGKQISKIISSTPDANEGLESVELHTSDYQQALALISSATKIDFSKYKESTIKRRMLRRMTVKGLQTISDYLTYLKDNTGEIWAFAQDAFIIVSEFYRDTNQFDAFKIHLIDYIKQLEKPKQLRIWVAGCAMGEEAYTTAMILEDIKSEEELSFEYKILATDISEKAISNARLGQYSMESLNKAPSVWLINYFKKNDLVYEVRKNIRDHVIFSVHNLFADPPFSKLDVITCRNLLIYFDSYIQDQLINLFHYSLNANESLLFLGGAESIKADHLFNKVSSDTQIYKKRNAELAKTTLPSMQKNRSTIQLREISSNREIEDKEKKILKEINKSFIPALVVLDSKNTIIYTHGAYSSFLGNGEGFFDGNFFDLIMPEIKTECRALVYRVRQTGEVAHGSERTLSLNGVNTSIFLSVRPLSGEFSGLLCLSIIYSEATTQIREVIAKSSDPAKARIEQELNATRENLQTVIEQLETANEQLYVYNEELQSSNEEYQSTNEELQTVNEELQSTNEELITVNEEYAIKTAEQLRLSSDLNNLQESLDIPFLFINQDYRIKRFTRSCKELFDPKKIKIDDPFFAIDWKDCSYNFRPIIQKAKDELKPQSTEVIVDKRTYQFQVSPYINAPGKFDGYTIVFYDTTDFVNSERALHLEKNQAQTTLEYISEGVLRLDENDLVEYANPALLALLNKDLDEVLGSKLAKKLILLDGDGEIFNLAATLERRRESHDSHIIKHKPLTLQLDSGDAMSVEVSVVPLILPSQHTGTLVTFLNTTEKQKQLERLQWQSTHDALTGLVNRDEMDKRLERAILSSKRDGYESSLLYLDLDQFKVVNDTCGHLAGDQLLKQLAELIHQLLRSRDTLGRLGGDEFAILLDRCPVIEAENIAHKIQQMISEYRFSWEEKIFRVGVSIGIVSINKDVNQIAEVLSDADAACYAAKEAGGNSVQVHSHDNEALELQRLQMRSISDINEAIENDYFRLYFHQIRNVETRETTSWEALVRMFNKKGELLLPDNFLPGAERFGLINRIDRWVIYSALNMVNQYFNNNITKDFPSLNINLSANTITDISYLDLIFELVEKNKISPSNISFEITETAAVRNLVKARDFMLKAKKMGFKFALDDFGTGMSSLSYLRELPIDSVKIDMSFIKNITEDPVNRSIVASVNEVAHLLNLEVIAEGIETQEQLDCLRAIGVDSFQGFLMGKPLPLEEFISDN